MGKTDPRVELDCAIINLSQVICVTRDSRFKTGDELEELFIVENGSVGIAGQHIAFIGPAEDMLKCCTIGSKTAVLDGLGKIAMPGFVDPHTHLIFAGSREHELELKLKGLSYLEILERGGGILYTVNKTRKATLEELVESAGERLDTMLLHGTTTVEIKSGYGLNEKDEIRSLEAIAWLKKTHPMDIVATFMGAHAVPPEFKGRSDRYIDFLIERVLPIIHTKNLAQFCDIFLEKGIFDVNDARKLLLNAKNYGMKIKLHVDEIENVGGAMLSCELGATSVEHLVKTNDREIDELAKNKICCIFLPGTPFSLMEDQYPRAPDFIKADNVVALATDCNPNCMCENMQNMISLACYKMKMTPAQAISASTINAAYGIGMEKKVGSIEVGKQADIVILNLDDYRKLPYHFGVNHVLHVIKKGKIEVFNGNMVNSERRVFILACKDGKMMLVKNRNRKGWEIPGGKVLKGESFDDAAHREFLEETGHRLKIIESVRTDTGQIYHGLVGEKVGEFDRNEIAECNLVDRFPPELNFPLSEYQLYMKLFNIVMKGPGE